MFFGGFSVSLTWNSFFSWDILGLTGILMLEIRGLWAAIASPYAILVKVVGFRELQAGS